MDGDAIARVRAIASGDDSQTHDEIASFLLVEINRTRDAETRSQV